MLAILLCILLSSVAQRNANPVWIKYLRYSEAPAVALFREYLRIDTSRPQNLKHAVDFWIRQAKDLGLKYSVYEPNGLPIFVATLEGADPHRPSIMLNSHMDVVKANPHEWKHPPFAAEIDENGDIYARGAQDMKDISIQYLESIRRIKQQNITLARNIHLTIMPDEEYGSEHGMKAFVKTKEFKDLNVGFALDEGMPSEDLTLYATFADKRPLQMEFVLYGESGHGSGMPDNTAMEKAQRFINSAMEYRETQKAIAKKTKDFGAYTSMNINMMKSGLAPNIIPSEVRVVIDMRLSRDADPKDMQRMVNNWMHKAGNNTKLIYIRRDDTSAATPVDASNPYWLQLKNALNHMGLTVTPIFAPATSDALVLRNLGIYVIGFTTKTRTHMRMHAKDEYQNVETFLKGIDIYYEIIKQLGDPVFTNTPTNLVSTSQPLREPTRSRLYNYF